jgi:DNA-binding IclR family transcriptional regulator
MRTPDTTTVESEGTMLVLRKAVETLNILAEGAEPTTADLATRLGVPRSSLYRLLRVMEELELVEPGSDRGSYRLGMALLRLGAQVTENFDLRKMALAPMEILHDSTGETVYLCIRRGMEAVCVERLAGRRVQTLALSLGGALPLHVGAASTVLLAHESRGFWAAYLGRGPLEMPVTSEHVAAEQLFTRLEEIRATGFSVSDGDVTMGIAAVGAPIFNHRGEIEGALSVAGVRPAIIDVGGQDLIARTREAADRISASLGHSPGTTAGALRE